MPKLDAELIWNLGMSTDELLLICKGLRCALTEDEQESANELGSKIARLRLGVARSTIDWTTKLERNLNAAEGKK